MNKARTKPSSRQRRLNDDSVIDIMTVHKLRRIWSAPTCWRFGSWRLVAGILTTSCERKRDKPPHSKALSVTLWERTCSGRTSRQNNVFASEG